MEHKMHMKEGKIMIENDVIEKWTKKLKLKDQRDLMVHQAIEMHNKTLNEDDELIKILNKQSGASTNLPELTILQNKWKILSWIAQITTNCVSYFGKKILN